MRGGIFYLTETLSFEPQDSGTAQTPIVYEAVAGEAAVLSGGMRFAPGNLRGDWHPLGDVEITTFYLWTMDCLPLLAVDEARHIATLAGPTHHREQAPLTPPTWYRAENVREALCEPGEYYLERHSGVLT